MTDEQTTPVAPAPTEPVTTQTTEPVTPTVAPQPTVEPTPQPVAVPKPQETVLIDEDKKYVTKAGKYIFQFPEGISAEKQSEYMQKVDEELKKYDRVVIDPKVRLYEQKDIVAPTVPTPQPVVNKVTVSTEPAPTETKDEFAELFLEE